MAYRITLRRDTSLNWSNNNPVLLSGEPGFETDTSRMKIGDGSTLWNNLAYYVGYDLLALDSHLIPATGGVYDLGATAGYSWRDLYLSGNTMYLGDAKISAIGSSVSMDTMIIGGPTADGGIVLSATGGYLTSDGSVVMGPTGAIGPAGSNGVTGPAGVTGATGSGGDFISVTYSELYSGVTGGSLIPGSYYSIIDFKNCYDQPDYDFFGDPIITGNYKEDVDVSPIIVFAISDSALSPDAYQPQYPKDKIKYDIAFDVTEVTGSTALGRITERIDEFGNRTDYDHRAILFRRYDNYYYEEKNIAEGTIEVIETTGEVIGTETIFSNYNPGDHIAIPYTNEIFFEIVSITSDTSMIVTGLGIPAVPAGSSFYSAQRGGLTYKQNNISIQYTEHPTFLLGSEDIISNYIGDVASFIDWGGNTFLLPNNVFGEDVIGNRIGNDFRNNTFNSDVEHNVIGDQFEYNTIYNEEDFTDNQIAANFRNNLIICVDFNDNAIGDNFNDNKFFNNINFVDNQIGVGFNSNTIYDDFGDNKIGNGFYNNVIDGSFTHNSIGNQFYNNGIFRDFENNAIGNEFYDNTISSYFNSNKIGNIFENNTIGDPENQFYNFEKNVFGNSHKGNLFIQDFYGNTFKEFSAANEFNGLTENNSFGSYIVANDMSNFFTGNTMGDNLFGNTIGDNFQNNQIGNGFSSNSISNFFSDNVIGNQFMDNTIADDFGFGGSLERGNKIGNNFIDNTIGEYFYDNTIGDNFELNTIGDYFQFNRVETPLANIDFTENLGKITGHEGTPGVTGTDGTYSGVTGTTDGQGVDAEFTLGVSTGIVNSIENTNQGRKYKIGDTITIDPSAFGGTEPLPITVTDISAAPMVYKYYNKTIQRDTDETVVLVAISSATGLYVSSAITAPID